jgi:hypothetical protein
VASDLTVEIIETLRVPLSRTALNRTVPGILRQTLNRIAALEIHFGLGFGKVLVDALPTKRGLLLIHRSIESARGRNGIGHCRRNERGSSQTQQSFNNTHGKLLLMSAFTLYRVWLIFLQRRAFIIGLKGLLGSIACNSKGRQRHRRHRPLWLAKNLNNQS